MDVIDHIAKLQSERGWTTYQLAENSGIPYSTLSAMFSRGTTPKIETLECICGAFGITLSQFFTAGEETEMLNGRETRLIELFRRMSEKRQELLLDILDETVNNDSATVK